ncbi:MAG: protein kinase [Verrucomicrobia bacterium]|nr:protein kinase [Verrucomicrobiota bacterium]
MSASAVCPKCGQPLPADAPRGICPDCLLGLLGSAETSFATAPLDVDQLSTSTPHLASGHPLPSDGRGAGGEGKLFGDYELLEEIARGGMGIVYKARQRSLNRLVALKMILAGQFASKQIAQRFKSEAGAAAILQHPNIVAVHDVGVHEGQHFFSMDFVEGQNLTQLVGNRPLPAQHAARYLKQIAEAIHYAHQQGILHRDLKPSNVLIDAASDQPRVTDFGLAKRLDGESSITMTGQVLGSPNFMPPEQASGTRGKVGRHSDVYGLGGILYFLLTARPPFQGETLEATLHAALHVEPIAPRLLNASVPRDLETICLKCLEKEPAKRYASAQELADELGRFLRDEPIHARPVTRVEQAWRWCRRKPALAALLAVVAILGFVIAIGLPVFTFQINRERQHAEENLYAADMHGAKTALEDGDLGRARELLEAHRPRAGQTDLRGFEWRLFCQRCRGDDLYALRGYSNALKTVKFSPDGDVLATRSRDNQLKVWDLTTRTERFTITNITTLGGFTSDGQKFVCGTGDGSIRLCDARTGQPLHSLEKAGELVAILADDKTVATTSEEFVVKLWDITSGRETFVQPGKGGIDLHGPEFGAGAVITPDGKKLAISNKVTNGITLWDLATREVLNGSLDQRAALTFLELSPDGKVLATGAFDGLVRLWDMATGDELIRPIQAHSESVVSAAFSTDGKVLATGSLDQTIKLWQLATRHELDTLRGHGDGVWAVTFSADGRRLASGSQDNTVRLWNTGPRPVKPALSGLAQWYPLIWSPDGKLLAGRCQDGTNKIWDAGTLETRSVLPGADWILTFSDNGKTIMARFGDGTVKYCDVATGKVTQEIPIAPLGDWSSVVISPDRRSAAITDGTPIIRLWDIASGKVDSLTGHTRATAAFAFSRDGHTLISRGLPGVIDIWEVARRQWVASIAAHSSQVVSVAISPDGRIAATGSTDNTIKLWNLKTRSCLATLNGHKRPVWSLAFSPDGKTLASGSGDRSVRLWNVSFRREVAILRRFTSGNSFLLEEIRTVSFSPDGNTLAAVNQGGDLILFRAATLEEATSRPDAAQARAADGTGK